jgi:epoxyqueuosine reductase
MARDFGGNCPFPLRRPALAALPDLGAADRADLAKPGVRLLIHADAGLWVAFRGALALPFDVPLPPAPTPAPPAQPETLPRRLPGLGPRRRGYDVPACRAFLDTDAGASCLSRGCAVRRACPASRNHARLPAQSAYHMSQFHP